MTTLNNHLSDEEWLRATSKDTTEPEPQQLFNLSQFSLKGHLKAMEKKMLADKFVLGRIAIVGQATVIYAKPNTGKTLLVLSLIIQSIKAGAVNGADVFYINADDSYRGLVEKLRLAEQHGFHMLAPGQNGFNTKLFISHLQTMIKENTAHGKVIILDTLKKFTDLMDKKLSTEFMRTGRAFVVNGGTLILLAHTNKNRDGEGKVIFAGTSDVVDDVDCAFILDEISGTGEKKSVLFENIKARGDVAQQAGYSYSTYPGQTYHQRLNSVESLDKAAAEQIKITQRLNEKLEKDEPIINAIRASLESGNLLKTDLIRAVHEDTGFSKLRINKALNDYTGIHFGKGHRWYLVPGDKNAKIYSILRNIFVSTQSMADEYRAAKRGEK
jgi:archaellum biogenesis ATPase FlaH